MNITNEKLERLNNGQPIRVRLKESHWMHKAIAFVLSFLKINDDYMSFWTTINQTIYVPNQKILDDLMSDNIDRQNLVILAHELMHTRQARIASFPVFAIHYLTSAKRRAQYEAQGYTVQLLNHHILLQSEKIDDLFLIWITDTLIMSYAIPEAIALNQSSILMDTLQTLNECDENSEPYPLLLQEIREILEN